MKLQTKINTIKTFFILLLLLTLLPTMTHAAGEGRLRLSVAEAAVELDQQVTVEVFVEEATGVYGTEVRLQFDPQVLEAVSVNHGTFLSADPDKDAFVLENKANNQTGKVEYALSLLNPAPAVDGSGLLFSVTFQTKAEGQTTIEFEEGLFGTQAGEEINPVLENVQLSIGTEALVPAASDAQGEQGPSAEPRPIQSTTTASSDNSGTWLGLSLVFFALIVGGLGLLGVAILFGIWFWLNRSKRRKKQPVRPVPPNPNQHLVR